MDMSGTSTMSGMPSSETSSSSSMSSSMTMTMEMVFTNSHTTPLFSSSWAPSTPGQYAATCIFLIILGIIGRCLMAFKASMERKWLAIALDRRYVVVTGNKTSESALGNADLDNIKTGVLRCQGVDETVRIVRQVATETQSWRFRVDIPRACLAFLVAGVSYLLMLAIMTMNVGYFMSVLAGVFIGELAVGRYMVHWNEH